jgi:repressor LexA
MVWQIVKITIFIAKYANIFAIRKTKSEKMSTTKQRILQFIEYQGIPKQRFFERTGLKRGILDADKLGSSISDIYLARILATYPSINPEWLLTGRGEMTFSEPVAKLKASIPLIPIDALAGWGAGDSQVMPYDVKHYHVPEFTEQKADFLIAVKGDSMEPRYHTGDIVACKKLPLDTFFQWNKVYVLDTVQGAMIKRVGKSAMEGHITCISENPDYPPFDLALPDIHALAIVLGMIRME